MELDTAIELLKKAVKYTGTNDEKHIDLTLVSANDRPMYEEALKVSQLSIKEGKITRDEFLRRVHLDH
jgi:hypothetical protein